MYYGHIDIFKKWKQIISHKLSFYVKYVLTISSSRVAQYFIVWLHHQFLIKYLSVFNFVLIYTLLQQLPLNTYFIGGFSEVDFLNKTFNISFSWTNFKLPGDLVFPISCSGNPRAIRTRKNTWKDPKTKIPSNLFLRTSQSWARKHFEVWRVLDVGFVWQLTAVS